jgi:hypothetical protein
MAEKPMTEKEMRQVLSSVSEVLTRIEKRVAELELRAKAGQTA